MLRFIFNRWRKKKWAKNRLVFQYWDGTRIRCADPFRLYRDLQSVEGVDIAALAPMVDEGSEPETTQVVNAIAKVFDVPRLNDQGGLTDWEILNLLADLNNYLLSVKKKYNPGPTSPQPTA